ncbi:hypothetical protein [Pontimicrobium sp. MEBiC01747]
MKTILTLFTVLLIGSTFSCAQEDNTYKNEDFAINNVAVTYHSDLDITVWEITVKGTAGKTTPIKAGQLDGAPVLGYVFPTNLKPTDVGFNKNGWYCSTCFNLTSRF